MIEKVCEICKEIFKPINSHQKWCSKCKRKGDLAYRKLWYQRNKEKYKTEYRNKRKADNKVKPKSTYEQCVEIERKCRELNMAYGDYVNKYLR